MHSLVLDIPQQTIDEFYGVRDNDITSVSPIFRKSSLDLQIGLTSLIAKHFNISVDHAQEMTMDCWKIPRDQMMLCKVDRVFNTLKSRGHAIAINTEDTREETEKFLSEYKLQVDCISCGGDHGRRPKPDPRSIINICSKLNIDIKDSIMVGDTLHDMQMGKSVCGFTVLVSSDTNMECATTKSLADCIVTNVEDLLLL